ncbi:MAG: Do family serine endopeptidase [Cytophagales bacterium]
MKTSKLFISLLISSFFGGVISLGGYKLFLEPKSLQTFEGNQNAIFARYFDKDTNGVVVPEGLNFVSASNIVRPTVVHVKCMYEAKAVNGMPNNPHMNDPFFKFFFEEPGQNFGPPQPQQSSGSGVVISDDGYIVTNNHVIDGASSIQIVLNDKRTYTAKLVGRDPETDLALLKIEEKDLPFAKYGNSEKIKIGEWVLACGNPFDLTSTITAGIVSAKGRNINLLRGNTNYAIESFIQTDAAVNPGNSGGALVNLRGELIGINTAIASTTGAYAGYSFAVPVTLVKKVMDDLLNHGEVQRALLGVMIADVTAELVKEKKLNQIKGVYISGVNEGSAAQEAGIKENDVILKIDDLEVGSSAELQEVVGQHRPGDKVKVLVSRENTTKIIVVTLKNKRGTIKEVKDATVQAFEDLGVELGELSKADKENLRLEFGVKVTKLLDGKLKEAGAKNGFIILAIDKQPMKSAVEIAKALQNKNGGVLIEGIYPDGREAFYAIGW